ncbi:HlyD family type I secretion periplasmic adaptor subunit [Palleronia sp.]|uniref:HlyD family type I secretion periplasmic adaptor subunit n=1 Tax=Palleronia sp. TaxID=1940284 RepID=UPI0035C83A63
MIEAERWPARGAIWSGVTALILLVAGFGYWASFSTLSGAIVVQGQIEAERNRQVVQHADGGIVTKLLVEEGDLVKKGQTLALLDSALLDAQLAAAQTQLVEYRARRARLEAESDGTRGVSFPTDLLHLAEADPQLAELIRGQSSLFDARRETARSTLVQLEGQRAQISQQIGGINAQLASLDRQVVLISDELRNQQSLLDRGLAQASRVLSLQREAAQLEGRAGALVASRAEAGEKLTDIGNQELFYTVQRREEAVAELRDVRLYEAQMVERVATLEAQHSRTGITAPLGGIIHDLAVFGPGAVIRAAEPMMAIIPTHRPPVIRARIPPVHIDQVAPGQPAILRFTSFDARTTPELHGLVLRVSADSFTDETTREPFYSVEISLDRDQLERLPEGLFLLPGMPVEGYLRTSNRTPLAYLLQPLTDYFNRALREG